MMKIFFNIMKDLSNRYKSSYLDMYVDYLIEFEGLKRVDIKEELNYLNKVRILKNCITHNMSVISIKSKYFKEIQDFANKNNGIKLKKLEYDNEYEILIDGDTIIDNTIKTATAFFKKLLEERKIIKFD